MYSQCRLLLANDSTRHACGAGSARQWCRRGRSGAAARRGGRWLIGRRGLTAPRRTNCSRGGCATEQAPGQRGGRARGAWCRPRGSCGTVWRPGEMGLGACVPTEQSREGQAARRRAGETGPGAAGVVGGWCGSREGMAWGRIRTPGAGWLGTREGRGGVSDAVRWPSARAGGPACSAVPALGRIVPSYSRAVSSSCLVPGVWPKARPDQ